MFSSKTYIQQNTYNIIIYLYIGRILAGTNILSMIDNLFHFKYNKKNIIFRPHFILNKHTSGFFDNNYREITNNYALISLTVCLNNFSSSTILYLVATNFSHVT